MRKRHRPPLSSASVKRVMQDNEALGKMSKEVPVLMSECAARFAKELVALAAPDASNAAPKTLTVAAIKRALALELKRAPRGKFACLVSRDAVVSAVVNSSVATAAPVGAFDDLERAAAEIRRQISRDGAQRAAKRVVRAQAMQPFEASAGAVPAEDIVRSSFAPADPGGGAGRDALTERERALDDDDEEEYG